VGLFSKDIKTMDDMLLHGLQDIYYAEQQITKALPKMVDRSTNRDLKQGLKSHLRGNQQADRAAGPGLQEAWQNAFQHRLPCGRRVDQGSRGDRRRNRRQVRAGCRDCCKRASGRALRDIPLRHLDRLGGRTRARRHRAFPHHKFERGKGANTKLNTIALRKGVNRKAAS
jgi:hypothetical protein